MISHRSELRRKLIDICKSSEFILPADEVVIQEAMSSEERILQLQDPARIPVQPWDDGTLKLAVATVWGSEAVERTAVSNAVPWSRKTADRSLKGPSAIMKRKAREFWRKVFEIMKPMRIATTGAIAYDVMSDFTEFEVLKWPSASSKVLAPLSRSYDENRLLAKFPEVGAAMKRHPEWVTSSRLNKVLFCCLAMTRTGVDAECNRPRGEVEGTGFALG